MAVISCHCTRVIHTLIIIPTRNSYIIPSLPGLSMCRCGNPHFHPFLVNSVKDMNEYEKVSCGVEFLWGLSLWKREKGDCACYFSPSSSVIQLKWVFLTAYSVELSGEFRLVFSRWLHPRLDYSLGFKLGPILRDAVWHFTVAYKRLPYIGPRLLSLCLSLHWPLAAQ